MMQEQDGPTEFKPDTPDTATDFTLYTEDAPAAHTNTTQDLTAAHKVATEAVKQENNPHVHPRRRASFLRRHLTFARRAKRHGVQIAALLTALPFLTAATTYTYDKLGRVTQVTNDDGSVITYTYDAAGNRTAHQISNTTANNAPDAVNDSVTINNDPPKTFDPRGNDTDADGDNVVITAKTNPSHGTLSIGVNGSSVTYQRTTGYTGSDSFTYTIDDGRGGTDTATVNLTVTNNNPPDAVNDSKTMAAATANLDFDPRTNDSDADVGDSFTVTAKTNGSHGTVTIISSGTQLRYAPTNTSYVGSDSFTYTITDTHGDSDTATVNMTLTNTAPVANTDSYTVNQESGANTFSVRSNDTDANGHTLTITAKTNGSHGTVAIINGSTQVSYTPDNRYWGSDSFTYTISDGNGGTANGTVNVTINQVDEMIMTTTNETFGPYYNGYAWYEYFEFGELWYYLVYDTRNSEVLSFEWGGQPPACNSLATWSTSYSYWWSGCTIYKDLTP